MVQYLLTIQCGQCGDDPFIQCDDNGIVLFLEEFEVVRIQGNWLQNVEILLAVLLIFIYDRI